MGFKAYKNRSSYTKENKVFSYLCEKLNNLYKNSDDKVYLLGNISFITKENQQYEIDALFIKNGEITIIDFKEYSGHLTTPLDANENWYILPKGKSQTVKIMGNTRYTNPYSQMSRHRYGLINYLTDFHIVNKEKDIKNKISGVVLFKSITNLNNIYDELSPKMKDWFQILDENSVYELDHIARTSGFLDKEILNFLELLSPTIQEFTNYPGRDTDSIYKSENQENNTQKDIADTSIRSEIEELLKLYRAKQVYLEEVLIEIENFKENNSDLESGILGLLSDLDLVIRQEFCPKDKLENIFNIHKLFQYKLPIYQYPDFNIEKYGYIEYTKVVLVEKIEEVEVDIDKIKQSKEYQTIKNILKSPDYLAEYRAEVELLLRKISGYYTKLELEERRLQQEKWQAEAEKQRLENEEIAKKQKIELERREFENKIQAEKRKLELEKLRKEQEENEKKLR
ncbi:NERD domain-containing protein [Actinobacillus genomosp. 2]|uniref:nuclease-related domain-containing protein n=1 Tax=Actinobacillus genomosp. 2 TaxID=230709 RepID=UPI0024418B8D|nr:nuclease-related domain-containing protein [Actinobacillus genomosp. 2]WGE31636.1 NERD domain-containing protein [Actinobacillus genomosp. 2]